MPKRKKSCLAFKARAAKAALAGKKTVPGSAPGLVSARRSSLNKWVKQRKEPAAGNSPVASKPKKPEKKNSFRLFTPKSAGSLLYYQTCVTTEMLSLRFHQTSHERYITCRNKMDKRHASRRPPRALRAISL